MKRSSDNQINAVASELANGLVVRKKDDRNKKKNAI